MNSTLTCLLATISFFISFTLQAQTTVTLPSICADCIATEPSAVTAWKAQNSLCAYATISVKGCATLAGAVLNDDPATSPGIEYDWSPATSTTLGVGFGAGSATRALVDIGGQCWSRNDNNIAATAASTSNIVTTRQTYVALPAPGYYEYSFYSAMNTLSPKERGQGVCPVGFHVPTQCEWNYLENSLGVSIAEQMSTNGTTTTALATSGLNVKPNIMMDNFGTATNGTVGTFHWTSTILALVPSASYPVPYALVISRDINVLVTNQMRWGITYPSGNDTGERRAVRCVRD